MVTYKKWSNERKPVTGSRVAKAHWCTWRLAHVVWPNRKGNVSPKRKVWEHTDHGSLLHMGQNMPQTGQGAHVDPGPQPKALTMGTRASELEHWAMEDGLVWPIQEWVEEQRKKVWGVYPASKFYSSQCTIEHLVCAGKTNQFMEAPLTTCRT